ncbi:MAG: anti-sigma factor antagonist [Oscillospiraceae bacterium]|jgi:stage II sporulation protein AA (anti-sigma F factor antagonist)|nr:anti-sigma factor antagonist [Oscillospiraceae bacterium]
MIETTYQNKTLTAFLSGDIDHHNAGEIRARIDGQAENLHPKKLELDFAKVKFMDSSGIGLIMGRYRQMSLLGGRLEVVNVPKNLERLMSLSGISSLGVLKSQKN